MAKITIDTERGEISIRAEKWEQTVSGKNVLVEKNRYAFGIGDYAVDSENPTQAETDSMIKAVDDFLQSDFREDGVTPNKLKLGTTLAGAVAGAKAVAEAKGRR